MDTQTYLVAVRDRMARGGYDASTRTLSGGDALIGYRSDFRISWAATKLHLFVAVKEVSTVSREDLYNFTAETLAYGKRAKGRFRGLQSGVGAIAALVAPRIDPDAAQFAQHELIRQFSAFAWPVIVDLSTGERFSQAGNPKIGRFYNRWMREQIAAVLPNPLEI